MLQRVFPVMVIMCVCAATATGLSLARAPGIVSDTIHWERCDPLGRHLQCAQVRVPLDFWDKPNGRKIQLAVIRHLAGDPGERIGSMFTNPGGPGDTGTGLVQGLGAEIDKWGGGHFDVVSWDLRGGNASTHVAASTASEARRGSGRQSRLPLRGSPRNAMSARPSRWLADWFREHEAHRACGSASAILLASCSAPNGETV